MMVASAFTASTSKAVNAVTRSTSAATATMRVGTAEEEKKTMATPPPSSASKTRRRPFSATPSTNKSSHPSSSPSSPGEVLPTVVRNGSNDAVPIGRTDRSPVPSPASRSPPNQITSTKSEDRGGQNTYSTKKVDRFGFIQNMDVNGNILDVGEDDDRVLVDDPGPHRTKRTLSPMNRVVRGAASAPTVPSGLSTYVEIQRNARREKKWEKMIETYYDRNRQPPRHLLLKRCRKGLPHVIRGRVWKVLGGVNASIAAHPGLYEDLVRKTVVGMNRNSTQQDSTSPSPAPSPPSSSSPALPPSFLPQSCSEPAMVTDGDTVASDNHSPSSSSIVAASIKDSTSPEPMNHTKSFRNLQDTIERDIHRTFPRHALFYEDNPPLTEVDEDADAAGDESPLQIDLCGTTEISSMIRELERGQRSDGGAEIELSSSDLVLSAQGGQASLRRVLKAYSLYDREIGYCQGMNFIAGMFLTLLSEEEAFWLLVAVMNNPPCKTRGLFGEGMRETHQVLHVAERLIHQFLPRLAKHLEREHIHITMFATQWLLTQYTSSFRFDLVLRVWDCFLAEGWKITYRVMLAILQQWQSEILKMTFEEILAFFRELPDRVDGNVIVDNAIKIPLRRKHITKYEREWISRQQQSAQSK